MGVPADSSELELVERLRRKYGAADTGAAAPPVADQDGRAADVVNSSLAHARLCGQCEGSGICTTVYEHRRMQSTCEGCRGEGVLSVGGARRPQEASAAAKQPASAGSTEPGRPAKAAQATPAAARRSSSRRVAEQVRQQIEALARERDSLSAALADGASEKGRLQRRLLEQLLSHLERLQAAAGPAGDGGGSSA